MIRRTLTWLAVGFGLGTFASMWLGPGFLTWYATPPGGGLSSVCGDQVHWATTRLVQLQLGSGIVFGLVLAVFFNLRARRAAAANVPVRTDAGLS